MKNGTWIIASLVLLVVVVLGWLVLTSSDRVESPSPTATSTESVWNQFKFDNDCEAVATATSTIVLSFRQEGATTTAGNAQVYNCRDTLFVF